MLSRIFKNSERLVFLVLPVSGLLAWFFSFFVLGFNKVDFQSSVLFPFFIGYINNLVFLKFLNLLFTIGGAFLLNYLTRSHEITEKQNFLPSFIYILLCTMLNSQSVLHPLLVANILVLSSLSRFFGAYRSENAYAVAFDASFMLSCGALFYWPVVFFMPVAFIAVIIIKSVKSRELILIMMGLVLPFLITATLLWIFNIAFGFWKDSFMTAFKAFHLPLWNKGSFLINTAVILFLSLSIIYMLTNGFGGKVKTKKIKYIVVWLLIPGIVMIFYSVEIPVFIGVLAIIPCSLFIGDYLGMVKKAAIADFLLLVFLTAFVFSNLQTAGFF